MKQASAKQRQWMSDITDWVGNGGMYLLYDCECKKGIQRHHVLGRSAKHNKISIGHEFIIPVPFQYHDISEKNDLNVTYFKHNFTARFGKQNEIFSVMYSDMKQSGYEVPSIEIYNAIMDTNA